MGFNNVLSRPADHRIASSTVYGNMFLDTETVSFTVAGTAAVTYELRSYYGTTIATGSVGGAGATVSLGVLPLGWYKLYFVRTTPIAVPWLSAGGEVIFAVVRATSVLKARPSNGTNPASSDRLGNGFDLPMRGFVGAGPARHQIRLDATNYTADKAGALADIAYENTYRNNDTARPIKQFVAFSDYGGTGTEVTNLTDAVQACVTAGVVWFEAHNEPNAAYGGDPNTYQAMFNTFCDTVHAASASAKTMGPCPITVGGDYTSDNSAGCRYSYTLITTAGAARVDAFSFHNYNGGQGDLPTMRRVMSDMTAMVTAAGIGAKPRFNTEFGSAYEASNGSHEPRQQAKQVMLELHVSEQTSVPKEQTYLFYDRSHGFWGFSSWWIHAEGSEFMPAALAPLMRVWAEELWGKPFAGRLAFGSSDNMWAGSRFTASDSSSVVVLQSSGHTGTVNVTVTGAASVVTVDPWGNLTTRTVASGVVSVPVDELPSYVRCPVGVTAAPVVEDWGIEVARAQLSTTTASSGVATSGRGVDGVVAIVPNLGVADASLYDWQGTAVPATWQANFPRTTRLNRLAVLCTAPGNAVCTLEDFDIQVLQSAVWNTVATFTEATPQKMWASWKSAGACYVDSWWNRRNQWTVRLASPTTCDGVRLNIRTASYGGQATPECVAQQSVQITGAPTGGTFRLTWNAVETAAIAYNATPAAVLSALQATAGGAQWTAVYGTSLTNGIILVGSRIYAITATTVALTGGTTPAVVVTALGLETGGRIGLPGVPAPQVREVMAYLNEYDQGRTGVPLLPH